VKTYAERLDTLHPILREKGLQLIDLCKKEGINILITQALRTIEEQDQLFAKGRTAPGKVVTNVRGGYSYHNYGLAFDFAIYDKDGRVNWTIDKNWHRVGALGKSLGLEWGGDWTKFKDYPHFQLTFGLTIEELRSGAKPVAPSLKKEELPMQKVDQTVSSWARESWQKAKLKGIVDGSNPKESLTRQEFAVILDRIGVLDSLKDKK